VVAFCRVIVDHVQNHFDARAVQCLYEVLELAHLASDLNSAPNAVNDKAVLLRAHVRKRQGHRTQVLNRDVSLVRAAVQSAHRKSRVTDSHQHRHASAAHPVLVTTHH